MKMTDMTNSTPAAAAGDVTPGKDTTEFQQAKSSSLWGTIGTVLGAIVAMTPLVDASGNSKFASIAGAIIAAASIAMKTLTTLGYIKSRTDVKTATGKMAE
jgi:hypothetical protein